MKKIITAIDIAYLVIAIGLSLLVITGTVRPAIVKGESMYPTLTDGAICIVVNTAAREGDIVVFRHDGSNYVKRIDHILPDGSLYVLGDNANNSYDSRDFGAIDAAELYGVVCIHT